jgi:hypothetical protein
MSLRWLPRFRSNTWMLALALLVPAPEADAQWVSRAASGLLRRGTAGRPPLEPVRRLLPASQVPRLVTRGRTAMGRPATLPARRPARAALPALGPARGLAVKTGSAWDGEADLTPAALDDPRVEKALEELCRDGQVLLAGMTLDVQRAWVGETAAGTSVRLRILVKPDGDPPTVAGRIRLEVVREAGRAWRLHAVSAGRAAVAAGPAPERRPAERPTWQVMILCPETGEAVPTGLAMTAEAFLAAELPRTTLGKCSACAGAHEWGKQDAHLH